MAVALGLRLFHVAWCARHGLFQGLFLDSRYYATLAAGLRAGAGAGDAPYLLAPLYPYFLALFPGVERPPAEATLVGVRLVQAFLGALTAGLACSVATRTVSRSAGWIAGLGVALSSRLVHYDAGILVACGYTLLLCTALWSLVAADDAAREERERSALALSGAAGIALGLAAALRATSLLVLAAAALVLSLRALRERGSPLRRPSLRSAAALVAGAVLVVAPFAVRNLVVSGERVLLSANGGFNFWMGNHAGAVGIWEQPERYDSYDDPVARTLVERAVGEPVSYAAASRWWWRTAVSDVRADPLAWLRLFGRKLILFAHPREIPQLGWGFAWYRARAPALRLPEDPLVLLLLALLAPFVVRASRGTPALSRLLWPALFAALQGAAVCLFFVTGRYRAPFLPLAWVLTAATAVALASLFRAGGSRRMLALASLAVVGLGFAAGTRLYAGPFALREDTGIEESQRLIGLVQRGVFAEAAAAFPPALDELDTDAARAAYATALAALGRGSEARRQYELVVARHPWNALAWYNLGNLLWEDARDAARAEAAFRRALAEDPRLADARFNLGVMLLQQRRYAEAVRTIEEALAQAPEGAAWREEAVRALGLAKERAPR